jgi:DNA gyrase subunit A
MGRVASGVRGIKLKGDDRVVGMSIIGKSDEDMMMMVVSENGYGKRTPLKEYKVQKRGGMGIRTSKITAKTGDLVSAMIVAVKSKMDLLVISHGGQVIRIGTKGVSKLSRATQGVRIMRFKKAGDNVSSVVLVDDAEPEKALEEVEKVVEEAVKEAEKEEKKEEKKKAPAKKKPSAKKKKK